MSASILEGVFTTEVVVGLHSNPGISLFGLIYCT
jgi:hypothetical protein